MMIAGGGPEVMSIPDCLARELQRQTAGTETFVGTERLGPGPPVKVFNWARFSSGPHREGLAENFTDVAPNSGLLLGCGENDLRFKPDLVIGRAVLRDR